MKPPIIAELRAGALFYRTIQWAPKTADLLERAARMIEAVANVQRRDMQNGPDCIRCDERERECDCAEPEREIMLGYYLLSKDLDVALSEPAKAATDA